MTKRNLIAISTLNMSREEWLEARRSTIGGSDAAAIVGLSQWATPLSVYMEKKGLSPDKPDSIAMRIGRELEETVAQLWAEKEGKKVRRKNAMVYNPDIPFAHANIDRMVVGEDAFLECKTTSEMNLKKFKNGEFPANYYVQVMHYLMVLGEQYKRGYLAVLVGNREMFTFVIERDEEEIAALREQEQAFYENYLLPGVMPAPSGSAQDGAALGTLYPTSDADAEAVDLTDMRDCFEAYIAANAQKALCERIIDKAKQDIEARLGNASAGFCGGQKVTWKEQARNDIDKDALKEMGVQIPYKQKTTRTFRFTAAK
jgi:putative phage-type endonuclease